MRTVLSCLFLLLSLTLTAHSANPADAIYHGITETELAEYKYIEVGVGDTLYGSVQSTVRRSVDHGDTWATWRSFSSPVKSVWIASTGVVYLTFSANDTLKRCIADGTCADVLTFHPDWAYSWHMAENDSLYCASYTRGLPVSDTTGAYVYISTAGNVWRLLNHPHSRHYHFVAAHPWNDTLYTSRGDIGAARSLEKSGDCGANFTAIKSDDHFAMPISFAFTSTRLIFGSDCGSGVAAGNKFYYQDNTDGSWTVGDSLSGTQDNYPWSMALDDERVVFSGTVGKAAADNDVRMYASYDSGDTWLSVKDFHDEVEWEGVIWISQGTDDSGYKYYSVDDEDGAGVQTYRFANIPVWTVSPDGGSGGDFATIATALADWRVGVGDTLILLAGTHVADNDSLLQDMTIRGATQDATLYTVKNGSRTASALVSNKTGTVVQDVTFRDLGGYFTTSNKAMLEADDGADLTVRRCDFMSLQGTTAPGFYAHGDGAGGTTLDVAFVNCGAESCVATGQDGGAFYAVYADDITVDGLVAVDNYSAYDGGVLKFTVIQGQTDIKNSLFINNRAADEGAAVYIKPANTGDSKVWHCTFDGNESGAPTKGQLWLGQGTPTHVISHCIFTNSDSTYALGNASLTDSIRHCNSWNTGENNLNWNSPAGTDTIHLDPGYNCLTPAAPCYKAKAKECRDSADGSYMGWLEYIPPAPPVPPMSNPALQQKDFYQDMYAVSDTVCCYSAHWDTIVPDLTYAGAWSIYPFGAKSKKADGINVKVTLAKSDDGWSDIFFIPVSYDTDIQWKNEIMFDKLFSTAVDSVAVQSVFSTCAAGSTLQYQFIMEGW